MDDADDTTEAALEREARLAQLFEQLAADHRARRWLSPTERRQVPHVQAEVQVTDLDLGLTYTVRAVPAQG